MQTFFDESERLDRLSKLGDKLEILKARVDFEIFRAMLETIWVSEDNRLGGRQRWDRIMIFKILVLQKLYEIADDATEYQINDRLSFQRFLGLQLGDKIPDAKTIWKYKEELVKSGKEKELFMVYHNILDDMGIITRAGSIVDATIIQRPQQRYNKEQKAYEKKKEPMPEETNPHAKRQIDRDARYTVKKHRIYFGYKDHVKIDAESKIITDYEVTPASTGDCTQIAQLVDEKDQIIYGDSAYGDTKITEEIQATIKAKIRCRVEHVFGYMTTSMGGKFLRQVGIARNSCAITLKNLVYNMSRAAYLIQQREQSALLLKIS
jgi:IS5 family transposase